MTPAIHRDAKPENVILKDGGAVARIDFGSSRAFGKNAKTDTQRLGGALVCAMFSFPLIPAPGRGSGRAGFCIESTPVLM